MGGEGDKERSKEEGGGRKKLLWPDVEVSEKNESLLGDESVKKLVKRARWTVDNNNI